MIAPVLDRRAKPKLDVVVKFVKGDSCPDCGERLEWNEGDQVHCDSCGSEYDVDWSRMLEEDDS